METKLKLINRSESYKLVIPNNVEQKIRRLLNKIYNIEWSGILFYTHEGNLKEGLTVTCRDILPMNIGNSTFTEFEVNDEVLPYMIENDLMDCQQSLVHSHHSMSTFFSSTDINTLYSEGSERNNFVSLIVNNEGKYNAAITWKETYSIQGTASLFGNVEQFERDDETNVCYSFMDIEIEGIDHKILDSRIEELKKRKNETSKNYSYLGNNNVMSLNDLKPSLNYITNKQERKEVGKLINAAEPTLFDMSEYTKPIPEVDTNFDDDDEYIVPKEVIDSAVAQLITGSLTAKRIPANDTKKILKEIDNRFTERFQTDEELSKAIDNLVSSVIETMATHFGEGDDISFKMGALAIEINEELSKYVKDLDHIKLVMKEVKCYEL